MYKDLYKEFLKYNEDSIHLSAHSHHFWPDVTKEAVLRSWEDSAKYSDKKWGHIFATVVPQAQKHIARILNYSQPDQIAFAPNTHELLSRLLSVFLDKDSLTILTTTSEFHSMSRQLKRLLELKNINAIIVDNEQPDFEEKFLEASRDVDFIFISHVFFNSGKVLKMSFIQEVIKSKKEETLFCIDGYHGFCAIPTDISTVEDDVFYLAGGYKYAQAGEGACFMTIPKKYKLRPVFTGWFASFETLENQSKKVEYSNNGMGFWGATQDLTPWYRFNSVWDLFSKKNINIQEIDTYIKSLMAFFIKNLNHTDRLMSQNLNELGHFLTLELDDSLQAKALHEKLASKNIQTDFRDNRFRFGFGMYLDQKDLETAIPLINQSF